jgi:hypothetical protein
MDTIGLLVLTSLVKCMRHGVESKTLSVSTRGKTIEVDVKELLSISMPSLLHYFCLVLGLKIE